MSLDRLKAHVAGRTENDGIPTHLVEQELQDDSTNIAARKATKARSNLDRAIDDFERAQRTVMAAADALHADMDRLSKRAKDSVGRAKDQAAQMTDAMNKMTKLLGPDFEKRLGQLEQLTSCMERLAELNKSGKLAEVLDAIRR